jgi:hypothetical protein
MITLPCFGAEEYAVVHNGKDVVHLIELTSKDVVRSSMTVLRDVDIKKLSAEITKLNLTTAKLQDSEKTVLNSASVGVK